MGGTLINAAAVLVGSLLGMLVGDRLPQRTRETVIFGLGLVVLVIALGNAQATGNILIPLFSIAVGALIGEALRLDMRLEALGGWLQERFGGGAGDEAGNDRRARFITGFINHRAPCSKTTPKGYEEVRLQRNSSSSSRWVF